MSLPPNFPFNLPCKRFNDSRVLGPSTFSFNHVCKALSFLKIVPFEPTFNILLTSTAKGEEGVKFTLNPP